jgi:hypothetical protein
VRIHPSHKHGPTPPIASPKGTSSASPRRFSLPSYYTRDARKVTESRARAWRQGDAGALLLAAPLSSAWPPATTYFVLAHSTRATALITRLTCLIWGSTSHTPALILGSLTLPVVHQHVVLLNRFQGPTSVIEPSEPVLMLPGPDTGNMPPKKKVLRRVLLQRFTAVGIARIHPNRGLFKPADTAYQPAPS